MSRRLPLIASPHGAPLAASPALPLPLDRRCVALVCEPGLDACAAWLAALRAPLAEAGAAVPFGLCSTRAVLGAPARALCAQLAVLPQHALSAAFAEAPLWVLVTDGGFAPEGARLVVRLCDGVRFTRSSADLPRPVLLAHDRPSAASALGRALVSRATRA